MLEAAWELLRARAATVEAERNGSIAGQQTRALRAEAAAWARFWHRLHRLTGPCGVFAQRAKALRLNQTEREILAALALSELGLLEDRIRTCADLLRVLALPCRRALAAVSLLSPEERLTKCGLVVLEDADDEACERGLILDPGFVDDLLCGDKRPHGYWDACDETGLYDRLEVFTQALRAKSDALRVESLGMGYRQKVMRRAHKVDQLFHSLEDTLRRHPAWKLAALTTYGLGDEERIFLLALAGKRLGHLPADTDLFTGAGLARAAASGYDDLRRAVRILSTDAHLMREGLIRPCAGNAELITDDADELEQAEFELTEKGAELLGLDKKAPRRRGGEFQARQPVVRLEQLVLAARVRQAVDLALAQARHSDRLFAHWGLGEVFPYGRGTVLLFSGPPGTGKTATAEALAHELGKAILVIDYSRVQNCFVGQTEKNIARAFREARSQDAVLFWDEADAMFYDRDSANRPWEVREVNVLLQEIERFDGVCVLATNRQVSLDKALQRRIGLRVEFCRPAPDQRRLLWERLLARAMPLAPDVDLDQLSAVDLTGGEIKNVILNAARLALCRDEEGPVTLDDFRKALALEQAGRWGTSARSPIGFARGGEPCDCPSMYRQSGYRRHENVP